MFVSMNVNVFPIVLVIIAIFIVVIWLLGQFLKDLTSEKIGQFIDRILKSDLLSQKHDDTFKHHLGLDSEKLRGYVKIGRELFD